MLVFWEISGLCKVCLVFSRSLSVFVGWRCVQQVWNLCLKRLLRGRSEPLQPRHQLRLKTIEISQALSLHSDMLYLFPTIPHHLSLCLSLLYFTHPLLQAPGPWSLSGFCQMKVTGPGGENRGTARHETVPRRSIASPLCARDVQSKC